MRVIKYRGATYKISHQHPEDLESTQKLHVVTPMREMIFEEYLNKIREVSRKLRSFGWMVIAHSTTLGHDSKKVVLMHINGSDRKIFNDLSGAIQYLAPILDSKKFEEEIQAKYM